MKAPTATYRVQLNRNFTFSDLKAIVPYLSKLGISHIYASPIFQAKRGSMHGYDVIDHNAINEELGGRAGFEEVTKEASAYGLGWLQDIVPNHASYTPENKKINDVLVQGAGSPYACFFDVDWNHPSPKLRGKIFTPFLEERYLESLNSGKIILIHDGSFKIKYQELEFPLNASTRQHLELSGSIQQALDKYNSNPKLLDALLTEQHYRLGYWRGALKHINYRRFFDIIDLIGVRMENPAAFEEMQRLTFQLTQSDKFSALRVDHIDGLYEPEAYLWKLRERCPEAYLVVEKILTGEEQLPASWPVEGTTGYDFANYLTKLFVKTSSEEELTNFYRGFTGNTEAFDDLLHISKKIAIRNYFLGDVRNLTRLFSETLQRASYVKPLDFRKMALALVELLACFPIYRTYLDGQSQDDEAFRAVLEIAQRRNPELADEFSAISFLLKESSISPDALNALMRFQQFSGAVMAKGFEDTALYRYNRLLSLNDVGSSPDQFGVSPQQLHEFNQRRQQKWPRTLNASSTHDSKRGEDVRARIDVLSEVPSDWQANVKIWAQINQAKKKLVDGKLAPDANEEYYLYQTLLGAYPWGLAERQGFAERVKQHMVKALREAKVNSSWLRQNDLYHQASEHFVDEILSDDAFMEAFLPFQHKVAHCGFYNSLSQTLLKIACPGVPDFYQGSELWDLNLTDPDNRRPVDFQKRQRLLSEIVQVKPEKAAELLQNPKEAKAKLYLIYRALSFRKKMRELFEEGTYIPLAAKGKCAENVFAFCRQKGDSSVVVVVPRFLIELLYVRGGGVGERASATASAWSDVDWSDTYIVLHEGASSRWINVFTDKIVMPCCGRLPLRDALSDFPVAMLWSESNV